MWSLLRCCLIGALLATGTSLKCEVCNGMGTTCKGPKKICGAGEDTCITQQTVVLQPPVTVKSIAKDCANSSICNVNIPDPEINLGKGMQLRISKVCCTGDSCQTASLPELYSPDVTPNGLMCPGCFGMYSTECLGQPVACTGSQDKCIEISGNVTNYQISMDFASKGCANKAACDNLQPGLTVFGGSVTWLTKSTCTEALPTAP